MKRSELSWLQLCWPRQVEAARLENITWLLASSAGVPIVLEATGSAHAVEHRVALPPWRSQTVAEHIRAALPGVGLTLTNRPPVDFDQALEITHSTHLRPLRVEASDTVSRALLTALQAAGRNEHLILQWLLISPLRPLAVSNRPDAAMSGQSSPTLLDVLLGRPRLMDGEARGALRAKLSIPAWRAVGRVAIAAASEARRQLLLRQVIDALRLAEGPGVHLGARRCSVAKVERLSRPWFPRLRLNVAELVAVSAWPAGSTTGLPIARLRSRRLPPPASIPQKGRVIGTATFPGSERSLAISPEDSCRNMLVLGPTGAGKSTLLQNLALADIAAGRGVLVIEPGGDLISALVERIPDERVKDVVLIDPTERVAPVGLNPLRAAGRSPEAVADGLVALFRGLYPSWGPRTAEILWTALTSLCQVPGMTLLALPLLLTDPHFRRRIVGQLEDPVLLAHWQMFESWSEAERAAAIAPTLNRVRPFLRPQLRGVLGQAEPRFEISEVFERKVVLVNLARGQIGEASSLLGGLVISQWWEAALARTRVSPEKRHPVFVYLDEAQTFMHLQVGLGDALARVRGLGCGITLANQHRAQWPLAMRSDLANARSCICFQLGAEDARVMARNSGGLEPEDFQELGSYEIYARLVAAGAVQPWCSARTLSAGPSLGSGERVRRASREHYGINRHQVENEIGKLFSGGTRGDDLAPKRRVGGGRQ